MTKLRKIWTRNISSDCTERLLDTITKKFLYDGRKHLDMKRNALWHHEHSSTDLWLFKKNKKNKKFIPAFWTEGHPKSRPRQNEECETNSVQFVWTPWLVHAAVSTN